MPRSHTVGLHGRLAKKQKVYRRECGLTTFRHHTTFSSLRQWTMLKGFGEVKHDACGRNPLLLLLFRPPGSDSWQEAYIFYCCRFYPLSLFFFRRLISEVLGRSSPNFAICSVVTVIFEIELEIWGVPPPKNLAAQKRQNFGEICDNFATLS